MNKVIIVSLLFLISPSIGSADTIDATTTTTYANDPNPTGGAPCNKDSDCSGIYAGYCQDYNTINDTHSGYIGYCVCFEDRADPDCSYKRYEKDIAGGLQFICFAGVGGVGNFYIGRTGPAVGQLLLLLSCILLCIFGCVALCCMCCDSSIGDICGATLMGVGGCIVTCLTLAGLIWCIVDGVQMLNGNIVDGNGYAMY